MKPTIYQDRETEHISRFKEVKDYHPMKPKTKLPKARVMHPPQLMWGHPVDFDPRYAAIMYKKKPRVNALPVAVIPTPSASNARQIVRFFNLTEDEQIVALSVAIHDFIRRAKGQRPSYGDEARSVLAAIRGGAK